MCLMHAPVDVCDVCTRVCAWPGRGGCLALHYNATFPGGATQHSAARSERGRSSRAAEECGPRTTYAGAGVARDGDGRAVRPHRCPAEQRAEEMQ